MERRHAQDRVIEVLVRKGLVTAADVERAQRLAAADKEDHGVVYHLVRLGAIQPAAIVRELAEMFKVRGIDLSNAKIKTETLGLLPRQLIVEHRIVPIGKEDRKLLIAMADPTDLAVIDQVRFLNPQGVIPIIADEYSLDQFIQQHFAESTNLESLLSELNENVPEIELVQDDDIAQAAIQEEIDQAPVVKLVNELLIEAIRRGASDIHFEVFDREIRVRFRIDGSLIVVARPPKKFDRALLARLKVLAKLNTSEKRVPQDGRIRMKIENRTIDFRVSTLPTHYGEKVVLRILDRGAVALDLSALGMDSVERDAILRTIQNPYGMLFVTGPTGSGKTTTLYSLLSILNQPDVNILTVEDPVEFELNGITQTSVKPEVGYTFANALKAFLRQDPDVIMVGEVRDQETAEIAVKAALTGHLVLSTLHTNDSVSAITRLIQLGADRFNIATAVKMIVAQRLVRRICEHCKEPVTYTDDQLRRAHISKDEAARIKFMRGAGCNRCNNTGYRGRIGLYEMFPITNPIADLIVENSSTSEIRQLAIREGMQTLRMTGLRKVREGITTLEEIVKETVL